MSKLSSMQRKTKLSQAVAESSWHLVEKQNLSIVDCGMSRGSFFRIRPCFKIPISSINIAVPAKCVSLHAEMVHCLVYIIYGPQLGVIPQGHQARDQYPETDSFELSLPSSNLGCISMVPCVCAPSSWFTQGTSNRG